MNNTKLFTIKNFSRLIFLSFAIGLVWYITLSNFAPFAITEKYSSQMDSKYISVLGPSSRITKVKIDGDETVRQNEDLIYFTISLPLQFNSANIKMTYKNDSLDQEIYMGYQDQDVWHYNSSLFDSPLLTSLTWNRIGDNPVLYRRENNYKSVNDFLNNPPKNKLIGIYNFEKESLENSFIKIPDYKVSREDTIINVPLRGSHTLYAYLDKEPFRMSIEKQDINWYHGEDLVNIRIYKDKDNVYSADIPDDGIVDNSKQTKPAQEVNIQNPGPGLPESGVYKVVIDAGGDNIITKISTNLNKIVFADTVFLAGNKDAYPNVIKETIPTNLFTESKDLRAITYHSAGLQRILIDDNEIPISKTHEEVIVASSSSDLPINIPKNDIVIKATPGYFAFEESQYFNPTPYSVVQIKEIKDIEKVDYILTSNTSKTIIDENGWKVSEYTFDLKDAVVKDGRLSWLIKAPGLKENNRSILIKQIDVTLTKNPIKLSVPNFKFPL